MFHSCRIPTFIEDCQLRDGPPRATVHSSRAETTRYNSASRAQRVTAKAAPGGLRPQKRASVEILVLAGDRRRQPPGARRGPGARRRSVPVPVAVPCPVPVVVPAPFR